MNYKEAYDLAFKLQKRIEACEEYDVGYHFFDSESKREVFITKDGKVLYTMESFLKAVNTIPNIVATHKYNLYAINYRCCLL